MASGSSLVSRSAGSHHLIEPRRRRPGAARLGAATGVVRRRWNRYARLGGCWRLRGPEGPRVSPTEGRSSATRLFSPTPQVARGRSAIAGPRSPWGRCPVPPSVALRQPRNRRRPSISLGTMSGTTLATLPLGTMSGTTLHAPRRPHARRCPAPRSPTMSGTTLHHLKWETSAARCAVPGRRDPPDRRRVGRPGQSRLFTKSARRYLPPVPMSTQEAA